MQLNRSSMPFENAVDSVTNRIKVHIHCRQCGETYILRGNRDAKGRVETGFKRCLCSNENDFDIEPLA